MEELYERVRAVTGDYDEKIVSLEVGIYAILKERSDLMLFRALECSPGFFVSVIEKVYREDSYDPEEEEEARELDVDEQALMKVGFTLLHVDWDGWPLRSQSENDMSLSEWVQAVKEELEECDRVQSGMREVAKALARIPAGDDEKWPPQEVCDIMEESGNERMFNAFRIEKRKQRGVTIYGAFEGGEQEYVLMRGYRERAQELKLSHPNVAQTLRRLASAYEAEGVARDREVTESLRRQPYLGTETEDGVFELSEAEEDEFEDYLQLEDDGDGDSSVLTKERPSRFKLTKWPKQDERALFLVWCWTQRRGTFSGETAGYLRGERGDLPETVEVVLPSDWEAWSLRIPENVEVVYSDISEEEVRWAASERPLPYLLEEEDSANGDDAEI